MVKTRSRRKLKTEGEGTDSHDIQHWIRKVEECTTNPVMTGRSLDDLTREPLEQIGKIRCIEAVQFLDGLMNAYLDEVGPEPFDTQERKWKFMNLDFFHLVQALVWQQDERLIPALRRARDYFAIPGAAPADGESVEAVVCQIAIGRIRVQFFLGSQTVSPTNYGGRENLTGASKGNLRGFAVFRQYSRGFRKGQDFYLGNQRA